MGRYTGGSSAGLGKAQGIDNSLRADWLSCFFLALWEWRVARQWCLVPLRERGMWQSSWPASFPPAGLTLWPNCLQRWLATLSRLSTQVRIPVGLSVPGYYNTNSLMISFLALSSLYLYGNPNDLGSYDCVKIIIFQQRAYHCPFHVSGSRTPQKKPCNCRCRCGQLNVAYPSSQLCVGLSWLWTYPV